MTYFPVKWLSHYLLLLCFILYSGLLGAITPHTNIRFEHISVEQGLSQEAVLSIYQDSTGYMWFGTQEGLNRYNGYQVDIFNTEFARPESLSSDWVFAIAEDASGSLWVGTDGGGLNRFDEKSRGFEHFTFDAQTPRSISNNVIRTLYLDSADRFWVGTDNGLNRYHEEENNFSLVKLAPLPVSGLTANLKIRAIAEDSEGVLWIGTDGSGLFSFNPEDGNVQHFYLGSNDTLLNTNRIFSLLVDSQNRIWLGSYDKGLTLINPERDSARYFDAEEETSVNVSDNLIRDIFEDRHGAIWLATDSGLDQWNEAIQDFIHIEHSKEDPYSLSNNKLTTLYQDRGGVLWIGSYGGLNKWNTATASFDHLRVQKQQSYSLSNSGVNAFTQDDRGNIWIGTYGGLNKVHHTDGTIQHFTADNSHADGLIENRVMSLYAEGGQTLWIGTRASGLDKLDIDNGTFQHFQHDKQNSDSISANAVTKITPDDNGNLWIGTWGGGLNRFLTADNRFERFQQDDDDPNSISSNRVLEIMQDDNNHLWVGTWGGGISLFDEQMNLLKVLKLDSSRDSLSENKIWVILEDSKRNIWVGTQGGGISLLTVQDREVNNYRFTRITRSDGLPSNVVYGLLEDKQGFIWASSNRGLSKINPQNLNIDNFNASHGLQSNEFNSGAYFKDKDGHMYFGGVNGATVFFPDNIRPNVHKPPVVLTQFLKLNQRSPLSDQLNVLDSILLEYTDYLIAFDFAGLDFAAPEKNRYAYKLEGFDREWLTSGQLRRATYTNLPAGEFTFRVKAANNDQVWNEQGASINLTVLPPPWKTWWAYTIYVAAVVLILALIIWAYLNKLNRAQMYQQVLEKEVEKRTKELTELNDQLYHASTTDALSGLKNRLYLLNIVEREIADINRKVHDAKRKGDCDLTIGPRVFFMMMDLDKFKNINDEFGNPAGDHVIKEIAKILESFFRNTDTIIRWGSDEFLIVGQVPDIREINRIAQRLQQKIKNTAFEPETDVHVRVSGSIGFSFYPFDINQPDRFSWQQVQLIADQAVSVSKQAGRDCWTGLVAGEQPLPVEALTELASNSKKLKEQQQLEIIEFHAYKTKPV
ncbi:MAG: two-component regulator propeller domain-containing protein [Aestuariibacter sp.]